MSWRDAYHRAVCDRVEPWAHGHVLRADAIRGYWEFNAIRVEDDGGGLAADALRAEADRRLGDLSHRRLEVWDAALGRRLRADLHDLGWAVERLVVMRHEGELPALRRPAAVEEVDVAVSRDLREEWLRDGTWGDRGQDAVTAFLVMEEHVLARLPSRAFVVFAGGRPAAYARLRVSDRGAEVEDAYCSPAHRDRGYASACVARAVREARAAGAEDVWIAADDEDWPKRLYARLGFAPVWVYHGFTRRPT
jgi:GNAT superfamily N-acetyltransferase